MEGGGGAVCSESDVSHGPWVSVSHVRSGQIMAGGRQRWNGGKEYGDMFLVSSGGPDMFRVSSGGPGMFRVSSWGPDMFRPK